jgi:hypothetical protein
MDRLSLFAEGVFKICCEQHSTSAMASLVKFAHRDTTIAQETQHRLSPYCNYPPDHAALNTHLALNV